MGACLSGSTGSTSTPLISNNQGGEEEFHARFLEDRLVLGQGEFGEVKLCHDMTKIGAASSNGDSEPLAVKILKKGITFKDNTLYAPLKPETLQMECDILRTLNGKHYCLGLVAIYETPKLIYVVTELCSGGEMMEYVSQLSSDLTTTQVSRIAFQLLDAVHHMASHNIIHRDLKPENCMFTSPTETAELRVIDFGSGTNVVLLDNEYHTTFAGSAFYISPEMYQRTYTTQTDVWSAGVTLYVLVAGYPAEELQKAFNILQQSNKAKRNLRSLPNLPDNLPSSYYDLLEQLLTYRHKQRVSAGDVLSHEFLDYRKTATSARRRDSFAGSVQRHTLFLDYQKFERALTTILATMLNREELDGLLGVLLSQSHTTAASNGSSKALDVSSGGTVKELNNVQKLHIVPVSELKGVLRSLKHERCIDMIETLPNANNYNTFAYHIDLVKQFSRQQEINNKEGGMKRSMSISGAMSSGGGGKGGDAVLTNSVHGNDVYGRVMKGGGGNKRMAQSMVVVNGGASDNLSVRSSGI